MGQDSMDSLCHMTHRRTWWLRDQSPTQLTGNLKNSCQSEMDTLPNWTDTMPPLSHYCHPMIGYAAVGHIQDDTHSFVTCNRYWMYSTTVGKELEVVWVQESSILIDYCTLAFRRVPDSSLGQFLSLLGQQMGQQTLIKYPLWVCL